MKKVGTKSIQVISGLNFGGNVNGYGSSSELFHLLQKAEMVGKIDPQAMQAFCEAVNIEEISAENAQHLLENTAGDQLATGILKQLLAVLNELPTIKKLQDTADTCSEYIVLVASIIEQSKRKLEILLQKARKEEYIAEYKLPELCEKVTKAIQVEVGVEELKILLGMAPITTLPEKERDAFMRKRKFDWNNHRIKHLKRFIAENTEYKVLTKRIEENVSIFEFKNPDDVIRLLDEQGNTYLAKKAFEKNVKNEQMYMSLLAELREYNEQLPVLQMFYNLGVTIQQKIDAYNDLVKERGYDEIKDQLLDEKVKQNFTDMRKTVYTFLDKKRIKEKYLQCYQKDSKYPSSLDLFTNQQYSGFLYDCKKLAMAFVTMKQTIINAIPQLRACVADMSHYMSDKKTTYLEQQRENIPVCTEVFTQAGGDRLFNYGNKGEEFATQRKNINDEEQKRVYANHIREYLAVNLLPYTGKKDARGNALYYDSSQFTNDDMRKIDAWVKTHIRDSTIAHEIMTYIAREWRERVYGDLPTQHAYHTLHDTYGLTGRKYCRLEQCLDEGDHGSFLFFNYLPQKIKDDVASRVYSHRMFGSYTTAGFASLHEKDKAGRQDWGEVGKRYLQTHVDAHNSHKQFLGKTEHIAWICDYIIRNQLPLLLINSSDALDREQIIIKMQNAFDASGIGYAFGPYYAMMDLSHHPKQEIFASIGHISDLLALHNAHDALQLFITYYVYPLVQTYIEKNLSELRALDTEQIENQTIYHKAIGEQIDLLVDVYPPKETTDGEVDKKPNKKNKIEGYIGGLIAVYQDQEKDVTKKNKELDEILNQLNDELRKPKMRAEIEQNQKISDILSALMELFTTHKRNEYLKKESIEKTLDALYGCCVFGYTFAERVKKMYNQPVDVSLLQGYADMSMRVMDEAMSYGGSGAHTFYTVKRSSGSIAEQYNFAIRLVVTAAKCGFSQTHKLLEQLTFAEQEKLHKMMDGDKGGQYKNIAILNKRYTSRLAAQERKEKQETNDGFRMMKIVFKKFIPEIDLLLQDNTNDTYIQQLSAMRSFGDNLKNPDEDFPLFVKSIACIRNIMQYINPEYPHTNLGKLLDIDRSRFCRHVEEVDLAACYKAVSKLCDTKNITDFNDLKPIEVEEVTKGLKDLHGLFSYENKQETWKPWFYNRKPRKELLERREGFNKQG